MHLVLNKKFDIHSIIIVCLLTNTLVSAIIDGSAGGVVYGQLPESRVVTNYGGNEL